MQQQVKVNKIKLDITLNSGKELTGFVGGDKMHSIPNPGDSGVLELSTLNPLKIAKVSGTSIASMEMEFIPEPVPSPAPKVEKQESKPEAEATEKAPETEDKSQPKDKKQ